MLSSLSGEFSVRRTRDDGGGLGKALASATEAEGRSYQTVGTIRERQR